MKTEVYSWRLSQGLKTDIERAARLKNVRVSAILDLAVREWLARTFTDMQSDEEQKKRHASAALYLGAFASGNTHGSETVREKVRKRLARRYVR